MKMNGIIVDGCKVAYREAGHGDRTLAFLHGNSMSSRIFDAQISGPLAKKYRLLAFDLPGHGKSDNAKSPEATYTLPGYASVIWRALEQLAIEEPLLIGFSLGGNVALEMAANGRAMAGLMIVASCPLAGDPAHLMDGFLPEIDLGFMFNETFNDDEVETYGRHAFHADATTRPKFFEEDVRRTDGKARTTVIGSLAAGDYANQVALVAASPMPLAVVIGANDKLMNSNHIGSLTYANLWGGAVQTLAGGHHAPFRDVPQDFDALVDAFAGSVLKAP